MKLRQLKEHEDMLIEQEYQEILNESRIGNLAKAIGSFLNSSKVAKQAVLVGAGLGGITAGPAGAGIGSLIGFVAGIIKTIIEDSVINAKSVEEMEAMLAELKKAQKETIREFEKKYMTKERKTPLVIHELHKLNMSFVNPIEKLQKDLNRAKK
jgi:replication-associated recombination protein RarA